MKRQLGIYLMVLGLIIIAVPILWQLFAQWEQSNKNLHIFDEHSLLIEVDEHEALTESLDYGSSLDTTLSGSQDNAVDSDLTSSESIMLKIESIGLDLPVRDGVERATLDIGLGRVEATAEFGRTGNIVIGGYRTRSKGEFLNQLDQVAIGDKITIYSNEKAIDYQVYEVVVMAKDDLGVYKTTSQKVMTLVTTHPVSESSHKLVVRAIAK